MTSEQTALRNPSYDFQVQLALFTGAALGMGRATALAAAASGPTC